MKDIAGKITIAIRMERSGYIISTKRFIRLYKNEFNTRTITPNKKINRTEANGRNLLAINPTTRRQMTVSQRGLASNFLMMSLSMIFCSTDA
jgi:hypothetical protein